MPKIHGLMNMKALVNSNASFSSFCTYLMLGGQQVLTTYYSFLNSNAYYQINKSFHDLQTYGVFDGISDRVAEPRSDFNAQLCFHPQFLHIFKFIKKLKHYVNPVSRVPWTIYLQIINYTPPHWRNKCRLYFISPGPGIESRTYAWQSVTVQPRNQLVIYLTITSIYRKTCVSSQAVSLQKSRDIFTKCHVLILNRFLPILGEKYF